MADINLSPYTADQQAMDRRRKMAEAMQQQAIAPIEMPTMPGVSVSPYAGLAKMLQSYVAKRNLNKSDEEQKNYELAKNRDFQKILELPYGQQSPVDLNGDVVAKQDPLRPLPLTGNNLGLETGAGSYALMQALFQQKQQQQAATQRALEAQQQIHSVAPGASLFQGGKSIYTAPKESPVREVKTIDANGMPITKYIPESTLLTMGNIPDQYKGFAADLITAKNLPENITNDPQLLNLVGSQLNKAAGQVTPQDVASYMLKVAETRAKLGYEGIPFAEPKPLVAAGNPLVKPLEKITTQAEIADAAKKSGKTIQQVTADAIAKGYKVQ